MDIKKKKEEKGEIYLKDLAHRIVKARLIQNLMRQARRLETQGTVLVQIQRQSAGRILSSLEEVSLCSIKAFN